MAPLKAMRWSWVDAFDPRLRTPRELTKIGAVIARCGYELPPKRPPCWEVVRL